jgi:hypothetical protein
LTRKAPIDEPIGVSALPMSISAVFTVFSKFPELRNFTHCPQNPCWYVFYRFR